MKILALETSAKSRLRRRDGGRRAAGLAAIRTRGLTHSRTLHAAAGCDAAQAVVWQLQDMDALAVAGGAGQLHGAAYRRLSAAKGLAWAAENCPAAASPRSRRWPGTSHIWTRLIVCAMDARRNQVYNALFRAASGALSGSRPTGPIAHRGAGQRAARICPQKLAK